MIGAPGAPFMRVSPPSSLNNLLKLFSQCTGETEDQPAPRVNPGSETRCTGHTESRRVGQPSLRGVTHRPPSLATADSPGTTFSTAGRVRLQSGGYRGSRP